MRRRWPSRILWLVAILIVVTGFLGVDRVFYERVSLRLNTEDNPYDRDFYTITRPFWLLCRYGFGLIGLAACFIAVALPRRGWRPATTALVGALFAALVANLAQGAIGRLRPNQGTTQLAFTQPTLNPLAKERVSFPSGEVATAFALACGLTRLFPRGRVAYYAAATLVGVARLVNGAHYLSDVAAGAMLGVLVASALFSWVEKRRDRPVADSLAAT